VDNGTGEISPVSGGAERGVLWARVYDALNTWTCVVLTWMRGGNVLVTKKGEDEDRCRQQEFCAEFVF
jgi:hypothetical protein